eukprot:6187953-Pleurochrysis_carterae.AAC.2
MPSPTRRSATIQPSMHHERVLVTACSLCVRACMFELALGGPTCACARCSTDKWVQASRLLAFVLGSRPSLATAPWAQGQAPPLTVPRREVTAFTDRVAEFKKQQASNTRAQPCGPGCAQPCAQRARVACAHCLRLKHVVSARAISALQAGWWAGVRACAGFRAAQRAELISSHARRDHKVCVRCVAQAQKEAERQRAEAKAQLEADDAVDAKAASGCPFLLSLLATMPSQLVFLLTPPSHILSRREWFCCYVPFGAASPCRVE